LRTSCRFLSERFHPAAQKKTERIQNRLAAQEGAVAQFAAARPQAQPDDASVDLETSSAGSDSDDDDEECDEDDRVKAPSKRIGILRMKGKPQYSLTNGTKVDLVDGSLAYPFATSMNDTEFVFYVRKTIDAERFVEVFLSFFTFFFWRGVLLNMNFIKIKMIRDYYYIVVTERPVPISAADNRAFYLETSKSEPTEYNQFASEY